MFWASGKAEEESTEVQGEEELTSGQVMEFSQGNQPRNMRTREEGEADVVVWTAGET